MPAMRSYRLLSYDTYSFWGKNSTDYNTTDFDSNLVPAEDVSVDAVVTSLYFNSIIFVLLMAFYEILRRVLPAVYSSKTRLEHVQAKASGSDDTDSRQQDGMNSSGHVDRAFWQHKRQSSIASLPDDAPLDWIGPVFGIPWSKVRKIAGLDGYFFLRYIRMNVRIVSVSTFWFFLILVPIYATGSNPGHSAKGWYHISAANLPRDGWRMWIPCIFFYLFTGFILFVAKQEYRHFLELRQDFLAKGSAHVHPQHHYSLLVENIPFELRSNRALKDYFETLFPGKVHSASVVLNLPDLEKASIRCVRTCRRLEKSIAQLYATGKRPTHVVGRGRLSILGLELDPLDMNCMSSQEVVYIDDDVRDVRPHRGTRVDSISYYTHELAANSKELFKMQQLKAEIAQTGNVSMKADTWFDKVVRNASEVANSIMIESIKDNALTIPIDASDKFLRENRSVPHAEYMTSRYGSISPATMGDRKVYVDACLSSSESDRRSRLLGSEIPDPSEEVQDDGTFMAPFSHQQYSSWIRRLAGRLGLDFVVSGLRFMNKQLDVTLEGVMGSTMSSTGFVTFLDLFSTTCAAGAALSAKASVLNVAIAPEPREIRWENARVSERTKKRREIVTNILLSFGIFFWSFPLAAIQAFAKAEFLAQIPGMEWVLTFHGGAYTSLINGYLPVVALLGLILILPVIFEWVAVNYECRKTFSDIQSSMLTRYFYYQIANIYVSVTAGSVLKSLADIIDHPSNLLPLLGESLPTMVGYFIALLVTKVMAGLPMIFLRFGALSRMLLVKTLSNENKLTQRELDAVYRLEAVQYGWEFPTQLLVVVIVFTYAIICPVILPFGLLYFFGALIVYKKQVLYVYSPVYESGGAMFPLAVQGTLFGLVCGQVTFLGYLVTRGCYYEPFFLLPLPLFTIWARHFFQRTFVDPSKRLSLERAREYDHLSNLQVARAEGTNESIDQGVELRRRLFNVFCYRQPVLTELPAEPMTYRRGEQDQETMLVRDRLARINRFVAGVVDAQKDDGVLA